MVPYIIVKNTHEPIISREDFEAVQLLKESKRKFLLDISII
ncbi:recombinase family protein [Caldifermentibacillus hisashii]